MQFQHTDPPRRTCTQQADGRWQYRVRNGWFDCPREHQTTPGVTQYVVHDAMRPALDAWLRERGFDIHVWPVEADDLPTMMVMPGDDLMSRATTAADYVVAPTTPRSP